MSIDQKRMLDLTADMVATMVAMATLYTASDLPLEVTAALVVDVVFDSKRIRIRLHELCDEYEQLLFERVVAPEEAEARHETRLDVWQQEVLRKVAQLGSDS